MVPGLGFIGRRLGGGKKTRADATAQSDVPEGMIMLGDEKGFAREPQGAHDSVHSLHTMEKEAPSVRAKPSPPPSPTSTLPDVAFLDLNGTDSKSSEASISGPDDEPTLTADDREWQWHEPASEVDPKDAATPERSVEISSIQQLSSIAQHIQTHYLLKFISNMPSLSLLWPVGQEGGLNPFAPVES